MPQTIICTECDAKLKVAELPPAGRKMRCPKCGEPFVPARPAKDEREEDDGPAPRSRKAPADDDEDDRPPPKRRDEDDNDRDRDRAPTRKGGRRRRGFEFDGSAGDFFVTYLCVLLLTIFTLGLGFPWTICMVQRWKAEHTIIDGRRLQFNGTGLDLLGHFIIMYLLIIITLGIYMFWAVPKLVGWVVEHTSFADRD